MQPAPTCSHFDFNVDSGADPEFPTGERMPTKVPIIQPKFLENCMKTKENGPRGMMVGRGKGGASLKLYYIDPPLWFESAML